MENERINPAEHAKPLGYSYAVSARGERVIHFAGHTATDSQGEIVGAGDLPAQVERALDNLRITAQAAGAGTDDFVKLTLFVTELSTYKSNLKPIGAAYRSVFGKHFPAMTLVEVSRLWDAEAMIEIEGIAVTP